jgi:hypothetical protein
MLEDAYASGQCDLKDLTMYKNENNDQNFTLLYWWDKVKVHKKWSRHTDDSLKESDGKQKHKGKKERESQ